jgi:hypothetical protein
MALFCYKLFFSAKTFGILEKGNLSEQKKNWREKINLAKTIFPFFIGRIINLIYVSNYHKNILIVASVRLKIWPVE